jgi:hypothetical protein
VGDIYGKGDKGKATRLHSQIVRARGACENCGTTSQLQCAHIVTRRRNATRTDLANAFALCARCHLTFTHNPFQWTDWVDAKIGRDARQAIERRSIDPAFKAKPAFWKAEVERLTAIWVGLDDHERVTE